jgi:predicted outer membrane repeat protein
MNALASKRSSRVMLMAVLAILAMAASAMSLIPAGASDADGDEIAVSSWDELKDAVESDYTDRAIALTTDIIDDSDDEALKVHDKRLTIDLKGYKIDRQRGDDDDDDGRLFNISGGSKVYIKNGTLTGGHGDNGGCITIRGSSNLTLIDVIITDNYAEGDGGAIYAKYALLDIQGGKIADNHAEGDGGAIYMEKESVIMMKDAEISGNYAEGDGGALYSDLGNYYLNGCEFLRNHCDGDGGAIYVDGLGDDEMDRPSISGTLFSGNHTDDDDDCDGGAIYLNKSPLSVNGCTFEDNRCGFDGGAVYAEGSTLDIMTDTVFRHNTAPDSGGALRLHGGDCALGNLEFDGNHANACGGAVYVNNGARVTIDGIAMAGNSVLMDGGGLLVGGDDDNTVEIQGLVVIKDNAADRDGPNVFIRSGQKLVCGAFADGSTIGVEMADGDGKFTKNFGENNPGIDSSKIFFADDPDYYVANDDDEAKMFKSSTGGDMSDNTVWIAIGAIVAVIAVAGALYYVLKVRKPKSS